MCLSCGRFWTALQILWSFVYVVCGAAQLMAGIFFTISVPELHLYTILFAGSWNIVIGICGGMVACIGMFSSKRQEILLYMAISILAVNCVNFIIMEYVLYIADLSKLLRTYTNHMLIDYACFATRVASAAVLVVSFFDSQLSFCSMQSVAKVRGKKVRRSHEQVSDIEYIIPRPNNSKTARQPSQAIYDAYAQSWVFEGDENTTSQPGSSSTTNRAYLKVVQNGTPKKGVVKEKKVTTNGMHNGTVKENGHVTTDHRPLVHIESASDSSHSDRQLNHMKSFSRSQSPMVLSAGSSQISLENTSPQHSQTHNPPPIYECLERLTEPTLYRSRLNTALSSKDETEPQYQTPQTVTMRRVEATSPRVEKVQYASLLKELQKAIVSKKESSSITSPQSNNSDSAPASEQTKSSKSEGNSDVEFSKELEAALQLIQDLESPNTIETPSEAKFPLDGHHQNRALAVWRTNDASESSEKTLSAVGSLAELTSPLNECQPELYTFKPPANGKGASVIVRYPDSQSTSGYSSPTHGPTPNWSTTSSINGSNPEIKPTSYSIHNTNSATVISLFSSPTQTKSKQVTLVKIIGDDSSSKISTNPNPESTPTKITKQPSLNSIDLKEKLASFRAISLQPTSWKLNSLLRRKKPNTLPKLAPELEGAIIKSESLAYLTDLELLARHQRNQELQREIEKRVVQQLGVPKTARTESNC